MSKTVSTLAAAPHGRSLARVLIQASGFAAALALAAQVRIPLPYTPVPITLQTFVLYLGAAWLGLRAAHGGLLLYVGAALLGLPVMSGFRGGAAAFAGATGGYILGWFVAVAVIATLLDGSRRSYGRVLASMLLGSAIVLAFGTLHLSLLLEASFPQALAMGVLPFLPGDLLKSATAAALVRRWPDPFSRH